MRRIWIRDRKRQVKQYADFPGNTEVPQAVGTIASDFEVDRLVVPNLGRTVVIQARHSQAVNQVVMRHLKWQVLLQPFVGNNHGSTRMRILAPLINLELAKETDVVGKQAPNIRNLMANHAQSFYA